VKFAYIGDEAETDAFGLRFLPGEPVDVTDEHAIRKLSNNRFFCLVVDGVEVIDAPKKRGRPPKDR
jgi:hypothetical protein